MKFITWLFWWNSFCNIHNFCTRIDINKKLHNSSYDSKKIKAYKDEDENCIAAIFFRHKLALKTHKTSHNKMKFHHDGRKCNLYFGKNRFIVLVNMHLILIIYIQPWKKIFITLLHKPYWYISPIEIGLL